MPIIDDGSHAPHSNHLARRAGESTEDYLKRMQRDRMHLGGDEGPQMNPILKDINDQRIQFMHEERARQNERIEKINNPVKPQKNQYNPDISPGWLNEDIR